MTMTAEPPQTADQAEPTAGVRRRTTAAAMALLVEDNDDLRALYAVALRSQGFAVEAVRDWSCATPRMLEKAALAVVDIQLPAGPGDEWVRHLRAAGWTTPVVLASAIDPVRLHELTRTCGADGCYEKSRPLSELTMICRLVHLGCDHER
jgi:DNA-binding response OmpR family regulator